MYTYKCKILRVVDGDTVDIDIDLGFGMWMHKERVRMMGIDTPESRTSDKLEKKFGIASKEKLKEMLPEGYSQILKTEIDKSGEDAKGKFGRILGDFLIEGKKASEILINEGFGVSYHGQSKDDIQEMHLSNRERLIARGVVTLEGED